LSFNSILNLPMVAPPKLFFDLHLKNHIKNHIPTDGWERVITLCPLL